MFCAESRPHTFSFVVGFLHDGARRLSDHAKRTESPRSKLHTANPADSPLMLSQFSVSRLLSSIFGFTEALADLRKEQSSDIVLDTPDVLLEFLDVPVGLNVLVECAVEPLIELVVAPQILWSGFRVWGLGFRV